MAGEGALAPLLLAAVGALFAGFVKGAAATGFPLLATPLLAAALGPRPAVLAISLPALLLNTIQVIFAPGAWPYARRVIPVLVCEIAGIPLGVWLLVNLDQRALSIAIGLAVLVFALGRVRFPHAALPAGRTGGAIGALIGFVAGVMGGTTTFFGPPLTLYLYSLRLDKDVFVFLVSLTFEVVNLAQVGTYIASGLYSAETLAVAAALCPSALAGFVLGLSLRRRIHQRAFDRLVLAVIVVSGLSLVLRPLLG